MNKFSTDRFNVLRMTGLTVLLLAFCPLLVGQVLFSEDFNDAGVIPPGWIIFDEDNEAGQNGYQNAFSSTTYSINPSSGGNSIWVPLLWSHHHVRSQAMSTTSRFNTKGKADDWLVSPPIGIGSSSYLFWEANTAGPFPHKDSYEVRISNMPIHPVTNPGVLILFVDQEASSNFKYRKMNLGNAGFSNQNIYLAWRNVSENGNLLRIDNIKVIDGNQSYADVAIEGANEARAYLLPSSQKFAFNAKAVISNTGIDPVTNVGFSLNIYNSDLQPVFNSSSNIESLLQVDEVVTLTSVNSWLPPDTGRFFMNYVVSIDQNDQIGLNDTFTQILTITDSIYSIENGITAGSIGILDGGALGRAFTIYSEDILTSITTSITADSLSSIGTEITAGIFALVNDTPIFRIASTRAFIIQDTGNYTISLSIDGGALALDPGEYLFLIDIPASGKEALINYTDDLSDPNANWVTKDYLNWFHAADQGFPSSIIIRPNFGDNYTCIAPQKPAAIAIGTTSSLLHWEPVNQAIGYEISGNITGSPPSTYVVILRLGQSNTSFQVNNLCVGQAYDWRIRTLCSFDGVFSYSDYTSIQTFTTKSCSAPGMVSTNNITSNAALLNWSRVEGAIGYKIAGQAQGGKIVTILIPGGSVTQLQVNNLPSATNFIWQVQAGCALSTPCSGVLPVLSLPVVTSFSTLAMPNQKNTYSDQSMVALDKWHIYPNPTTNTIQIACSKSLNQTNKVTVLIYQVNGTLLTEENYEQIQSNPFTVPVDHLAAGVYLLMIKHEGFSTVKKLIIAK